MADAALESLREESRALNKRAEPLEKKMGDIRKARKGIEEQLKKFVNDLEKKEIVFEGTRYFYEDVDDVKCTIDRLRATLPEDMVELYIQQNTVPERKWRKRKLPPAKDE